MRMKIVQEYKDIPEKNIFLDKAAVDANVLDGRSIFLMKQDGNVIEKGVLMELNREKMNQISDWLKNTLPLVYFVVPDSVFESGQFYTYSDSTNIVLLHRILQRYLSIKLNGNQGLYFESNVETDSAEYNAIGERIATKNKLNIIDFAKAKELNSMAHLPLNTANSFNLVEDTIFAFKYIYYYMIEGEDELGNMGFTFIEKSWIGNNEMNFMKHFPIDTLDLGGETYSLFVHYPHQVISKNTFFSFLVPKKEDNGKRRLANKYFACVYSIEKEGIVFKNFFKFADLSIPDSVQHEIKKYSFGSSPKYFQLNSNDYVFYKVFLKVLDLKSGELVSLSEFLSSNFKVKELPAIKRVFDVRCTQDDFFIAYSVDNEPAIFLTKFHTDGRETTLKLNHELHVDFLSIGDTSTKLLYKNEDLNQIEVKIYPNPGVK
jgi:hypothetical protein